MIKEYKLKIEINYQYGDLRLDGEYICLQTDQDEAKAIESRFLYKRKGEKQNIGGRNMRGNANLLPGLYIDLKGNKYYIKVPKNSNEMFCEIFHGALTTQLKLNDYLNIEKPYISGAEGIIVEVAGVKILALCIFILPKFKELFKYLGTAKSNGKERDNVKEITNRGIYRKFVEGELAERPVNKETIKASLAMCILQSVAFFGDYSLHSSNIALYDDDMKVAKIDGGAAFRDFAKNSPVNILFPHEYRGFGCHKIIDKNYIDYYIRIPDLKSYLSYYACYYINKINSSSVNSICDVVLESIQIVKKTYMRINGQCPFKNKSFSNYFGMDLSIDEVLLAKQFEEIIHRNIKGFQRVVAVDKQNNNFYPIIKERDTIYSIQLVILRIVLSRGKDVKSRPGVPSEKDRIKNLFMDKFKSLSIFERMDFLIYLHLLCAPSRSISFSSKTAEVLASGLSKLAKDDPVRKYLGISALKQNVTRTDLTRSIKKAYEIELYALKDDPKRYPEYLIRFNGNSDAW